jgi:predicted DCC family thiol-disulfide oxidoreductase YuxK
MSSPVLNRFFGGSPFNVLVRLIFVSLIVGALMTWLDIHPHDVVMHAFIMAQRLWAMGFDAVHEIGDYVLAGALIVVPLWLIARVLDLRTPHN